MPDQYIEVEWNGVRTRVLVQSNGWVQSHTDFPQGGSMSTVHSPVFAGSWMDAVKEKYGVLQDVPDADAEYDRDVRGE